MLTIIGDVHGKIQQYKAIADQCESSICVGDFGFKKEWDWLEHNVDDMKHHIIMGNHDYYPYVTNSPYSLMDASYTDEIFTVRGANSIDKHLRTEGLDWFANEELTYREGLEVFDKYCDLKPKIVISHDCPQSVMTSLFGYSEKSNTRNLLEAMFEAHKPDLWIFGHHHRSKDITIFGTRFICLNELETFEIK